RVGRGRRGEDPSVRAARRPCRRVRRRVGTRARDRVRTHGPEQPPPRARAREGRPPLQRERSAPLDRLEGARRRARLGPLQLLTLVAGLGVAGLAKGATAMGLPLIATPILAGVFGPEQAVVIITIPIVLPN